MIAQEAGALIRGSPSTLDDTNWFTEEFLWGRKFIVVRCIRSRYHTTSGCCIYYFCIGLFLTRQYEPTLDSLPTKKSDISFRELRRKQVVMHNCGSCESSMTQWRIGPRSSLGRATVQCVERLLIAAHISRGVLVQACSNKIGVHR